VRGRVIPGLYGADRPVGAAQKVEHAHDILLREGAPSPESARHHPAIGRQSA
jgi:hypothetical protein